VLGAVVALGLALSGCGGGTGGAAPATTSASSARDALGGASVPSTTPSRSTAGASTRRSVPATSVPVPATRKPASVHYTFPVTPQAHATFVHAHHDYPATDIMARCGDDYRAVVDGVVTGVSSVDQWRPSANDGATRGGLSVTFLGVDGVRYYGSHLRAVAAGVRVGARVTSGQVIGLVGNSGDARGMHCHVHFGLSKVCRSGNDWWLRRGEVYPWPYLESWRKGGQRNPAAAVTAWVHRNGCPAHPLVDP